MLNEYISHYWGKARRRGDDGPEWHPVAYHCLDVAAVADAMLEANPERLTYLSRIAGVQPDALRRTFVLLIAAHDIGKFSLCFQAKSEVAWKTIRDTAPRPKAGVGRHDAIAMALWDETIMSRLGGYFSSPHDHGRLLWAAVAGHHGTPVSANDDPLWRLGFPLEAARDVERFVDDLIALLPPIEPIDNLSPAGCATLSWALAGLTVLADWIGSSQAHFAYTVAEHDLAAYWQLASSKARDALKTIRLSFASPLSDISEASLRAGLLTHLGDNALSPLQHRALYDDIPDGPFLCFVEDLTGGGKTEAAMILTARLMHARQAKGVFFALPSMATANAMYDRLRASYRHFFATDASPSLVLAHARHALHDGFEASLIAESGDSETLSPDASPDDDTASAVCSAWLADDRRKCFLADVGVGTVDQALMAVLPFRYQALRLWGLADKVLVLDEIHSFDTYMSTELLTLLEFHAALGGSVIALSATLSIGQRERLARAFAKGLGFKGAQLRAAACLPNDAYPTLSIVSASSTPSSEQQPAARSEMRRTVPIERVENVEGAVAHAITLAERGASVAWIRNTVDDVLAAADAVASRGFTPLVLHARMAMGDRLRIETNLQQRLGKLSKVERCRGGFGASMARQDERGRGLIVCGSQILEASLDYDVDGMITDLAPADAIAQRAGRLWRHPVRNAERPIGEIDRKLLLLAPDYLRVEAADWYARVSGGAWVYRHHGTIWRSAKALLARGVLRVPDDIRALMAETYPSADAFDDPLEDVPAPLHHRSGEAFAKSMAARSIAGASLLKFGVGYGEQLGAFMSEQIAATRLADKTTTFRLGRIESGKIVPWCDADKPAKAWALSELTVRASRATGIPPPTSELAHQIGSAKAEWPEWERDQPLLVLSRTEGEQWSGRVTSPAKSGSKAIDVIYSRLWGLRFLAE